MLAGCPPKDDLFIILGVKIIGTTTAEDKFELEDAIIKLLHDELGLEVILSGTKKVNSVTSFDSYANAEKILVSDRFPMELESSARRPAVLQRLKIPRKSLQFWLRRRISTRR